MRRRADIETAIEAGFDLHVPKPVDFDSFVPLIQRLAAPPLGERKQRRQKNSGLVAPQPAKRGSSVSFAAHWGRRCKIDVLSQHANRKMQRACQ